MFESSEANTEESQSGHVSERNIHQSKKRKNRPGYNTYLKVLLEATTIRRLYETTIQLQESVARQDGAILGPSSHTETSADSQLVVENRQEQGESSNGQKKSFRQLKIVPRSLTSLHMTLFFGGETICSDLTPEELEQWHTAIRNRLAESNFVLSGTKRPEPKIGKNQLWFRFSHLALFPPKRNYLVVAIYEASPQWHDLYRDLRHIAATAATPALREVAKSGKAVWTPHVTLGNIRGGSPAEKRQLQEYLRDIALDDLSIIRATGIGVGGPIPTQLKLDWHFVSCSEPSLG